MPIPGIERVIAYRAGFFPDGKRIWFVGAEPGSSNRTYTFVPDQLSFPINLTENALPFLVTYGVSSALSQRFADYTDKWIAFDRH